MYIWENIEWPHFQWNPALITEKLGQVRYQQGRLLGMADTLGFDVKSPVVLDVMSADIIKSSEIEGVILNAEEVRSSVAWQLGMDRQGVPTADRYIEGVVDVMFDALHHYSQPLTKERLFGWHSALFPNQGIRSRITVGNWRQSEAPMQVVSGRYGKETVHYEAPPSRMVPQMMAEFLQWLNSDQEIDPLLKAAIAHLWFVSIHPFSDGNGRLARTITDMLQAKADGTSYRFYSMSAQIAKERMVYYNVLEITQKGTLDITDWMIWFLDALDHAIISAQGAIDRTLCKASFWESRRQTVMNERQNKMVNLLWDGFEGALTSSKWAKICKCSPDTALRDITDLLNKRILVKAPSGGRSTHYVLADEHE